MDRAFDDPGDDDDEHDANEEHRLLGNNAPSSSPQRAAPMPGDYDFDRDYVSLFFCVCVVLYHAPVFYRTMMSWQHVP